MSKTVKIPCLYCKTSVEVIEGSLEHLEVSNVFCKDNHDLCKNNHSLYKDKTLFVEKISDTPPIFVHVFER